MSSDEESEDGNVFTAADNEPDIGKGIEHLSESESEKSDEIFNVDDKQLTVKTLIEEIKKRDIIINQLRKKGASVLSSYNTNKPTVINYHCVQIANADSGKPFKPIETECRCWWCDDTFSNIPAYIVNYYRNEIYYVFGNFCSFNCALKYNIKMLKDFKCNTRHALTNNLRMKVTGDTGPIRLAGDRELLKSKGGTYSIQKFREGFSIISSDMKISMPPIIPLVHVIEEGKRD